MLLTTKVDYDVTRFQWIRMGPWTELGNTYDKYHSYFIENIFYPYVFTKIKCNHHNYNSQLQSQFHEQIEDTTLGLDSKAKTILRHIAVKCTLFSPSEKNEFSIKLVEALEKQRQLIFNNAYTHKNKVPIKQVALWKPVISLISIDDPLQQRGDSNGSDDHDNYLCNFPFCLITFFFICGRLFNVIFPMYLLLDQIVFMFLHLNDKKILYDKVFIFANQILFLQNLVLIAFIVYAKTYIIKSHSFVLNIMDHFKRYRHGKSEKELSDNLIQMKDEIETNYNLLSVPYFMTNLVCKRFGRDIAFIILEFVGFRDTDYYVTIDRLCDSIATQ